MPLGEWLPTWRTAALLLCAVAVYLPALGGGYLWDDALYVSENPTLRSWTGVAGIWRIPPATRQYYPLTYTSFWIEYRFWGDWPPGYRATNMLLHAANAVLVWRVLSALEVPAAFAAACLFAVHPVHVESVAWIAERKNVLSGLFALLATLAWVRFLTDAALQRVPVVAWVGFTAALLSKTQVVALPAVWLLLAWWKRPDQWQRCIRLMLPLAGLALAMAMVTVTLEPVATSQPPPSSTLHPLDRLLVAGRALWFYAASLLWPTNLMAIYGHWRLDPSAAAAYAFPLGAAAVLLGCWALRSRIGKGPTVALASFLAGVAPTLGFVNFNFMQFSFVADHFQYLASIPLIALVSAAAARLVDHAARLPGLWQVGPALLALTVGGLAMLSWQRAFVHRSEEALWRDNIARHPAGIAPYVHLGNILLAQRRLDEAIDTFAAAARLDPRRAELHNNWGDALLKQGRLEEAVARFTTALQLEPENAVVHNNLGVVLQTQGANEAAAQHFADAIRLDPGFAAAHGNRGATLIALGRPAEAVEHLVAATRLAPDSYDAATSCGDLFLQLSRYEEAAECFRSAVRIDPTRADAQRRLGVALLNLGRGEQAIAPLRLAVRTDPASAEAHHDLGVAFGMVGDLERALIELETAARLSPGDADIQNHWGVALSLARRFDEAVARFQEALRLQPDHAEARDNLAGTLARRDAEISPESRKP